MEGIEKKKSKLKRTLKARHLNMIAIGGAIGTGLFLASGTTIGTAGPGGALLAYCFIGIMVYFLMTSLGEMATAIPMSGSFEVYSTRFFDPALGFALGWNFWYNWAITVAVEISASALVMKYWLPDVPSIVWSLLFVIILFSLNLMSVRAYGESEFMLASIKVLTVIIFLVVGVLVIFGVISGKSPGFTNWVMGEAPFVGGITSFISIFMIAGFSFQGTEFVGVAAGESENPSRDVPKAVKAVFWRILLFYIGAIIIIGFIVPYTDPNLLKSNIESVAVSPFTIVFDKVGLAFSASVMNAVVLTAILSSGNSGVYASTRMLHALAVDGKAPKFISKVNKRGVPINALCLTIGVSMICFLSSLFGDKVIYTWLVNASALTGIIAWMGIALCHYRFRKAYIAQGRRLEELNFKAKWYPFGPIFAIVLCSSIILGQGYNLYVEGNINWIEIFITYLSIPIFFALFLGYKIIRKTKMIPLEEANFEVED